MKTWKLLLAIIMVVFISACGKQVEETSSESKDKTEKKSVEESEKNTEAVASATESFTFPSTLKEAEAVLPGSLWEKQKNDEMTKADKEKILESIVKIDKLEENVGVRAESIKKLLFEAYHPELPGLASFEPRGKISIEDLNAGSNVKLNGREVKENINIAIILDASGSMKAIQDGKTQMEIAKEAIEKFVSNLPENTKVSLTIYGYEGTGSEADKAKSCKSIKEIYPLSNFTSNEFSKALSSVKPAGWTPIADSLKQTQKTLQGLNAENNTNVVYLVSDGVETCDGDPAKVAKDLSQSNIDPIINVIGFSVGSKEREQLEEIAEQADGRYIHAKNQEDLEEEFQKSNDSFVEWINWRNQHNVDAINQRNHDNVDIINLKNETINKMIIFRNSIINLLIEAKNKHDLNLEVYESVKKGFEDYYTEIKEAVEEDYDRKNEMIDGAYNDAKEEITETYEDNTN